MHVIAMRVEIAARAHVLRAYVTLKRFGAMRVHVLDEILFRDESLAADVTHVLFVAHVTLHVTSQVVGQREAPVTVRTSVRPFVAVYQSMPHVAGFVGKQTVANSAFERIIKVLGSSSLFLYC